MEAFIATILLFAGNFAPRGWLFCQGQLLPINQNQALFSLLGTTYGGDGVTTFALPDLRSRVPVGAGQGPGLTNRALGEKGGTETVALSAEQLPAHTHQLLASTAPADLNDPTNAALAQTVDPSYTPGPPVYAKDAPTVPMMAGSVGAAGGSQSHPNMPPYLGLNYIICLEGIYPSRP